MNRQVNSILLLTGGLLMVGGAVAFAATLSWRPVACWVYLAGALLFCIMQSLQPYDNRDMVMRRLKRLQGLAAFLLVLAGLLMVSDAGSRPLAFLRRDYYTFVTYFYNKWVLLLLAGSLIEVYTTLRLSSEKNEKA